ncbi:hypothetical protein [Ligilactobacillus sp. LYQ60]|uniref:hypothetical protein n=1 Tax=Ligilactobacillus sp. LYQ60 TaxID=3378799 RepID=UPI0038550916
MNLPDETGVLVWLIKRNVERKKLLTIIRLAGKIITVANEWLTVINWDLTHGFFSRYNRLVAWATVDL